MNDGQAKVDVYHKMCPLISLNAVAFDSETTGLDARLARMIQLGAVRITRGQIEEQESFQSLINPGSAIPESSSLIHGIHDSDVTGAAEFIEINSEFNQWCGNRLLIGYGCNFDLALMKREHELAGVDWKPPETLDVRHLVNFIAPDLPDFSLETIASWLGVEVINRHNALGDAITTARIFIALIPLLRDHGIRTLAEAERVCRQFGQANIEDIRPERHDLQRPANSETDTGIAVNRIDSYPYRHRLRDLMVSPVLWVDADENLAKALIILMDEGRSAVFVRPDRNREGVGIVTERDLLRCLNHQGRAAFELPVKSIASYPLQSLPADSFVYRAISRMQRLLVRHLGVHDIDGNIVGVLSARSLLGQHTDNTLVLGDEIDHATSAEMMAETWSKVAIVALSLSKEGVDACDIAAIISTELRALTRQACKIVEQQMSQEGFGGPPSAYAMLVLGSGGRGESLLAMEQDNAIIYQQDGTGNDHDKWFAELGKRVSDILHIAGLPYCRHGFMASHSDWCQSEQRWKNRIDNWINRQAPSGIPGCDIFFDSVCVHGDYGLAKRLRDYAYEMGSNSKDFIRLMSINAVECKSPLGFLGRFQLDNGRIDLKVNGLMPLCSCARVLAIQKQCRLLETPQRLLAVLAQQNHRHATFENLIEAYRFFLKCILQQQLVDLEKGIPLSNKVAADHLEATTRKQLKWALKQVSKIPSLLEDPLSAL